MSVATAIPHHLEHFLSLPLATTRKTRPSRSVLPLAKVYQYHLSCRICILTITGNGYKYAGLEYYGQCFCGDSIAGSSVPETQCKFACTGNKLQTCGGNDILSVYVDPTFPIVDPNTISDYMPQGCFAEGNSGRAVTYRQNQLDFNTLTTEKCLSACKVQGYPLAGTEYGGE